MNDTPMPRAGMAACRMTTMFVGAAVFLGPVPSRSAQAEQDTASVPVVHNPAASEAMFTWTVGSKPSVEVGGAMNDPRYQLFQVTDAVRLADGPIIVANNGTHELRFYNEQGTYLSAVGREGEGPGEFRVISGVHSDARDSIYVYDSRLQRVTVLDSQGRLARIARVRAEAHAVGELGRFRDGRWYAEDGVELTPGAAGTIQEDTAHFMLYDARFRPQSMITAVPGVLTAHQGFGHRKAPFTPRPAYDDFGNCLYVTSGRDFEVRVFSSDGQLIRVVRNAGERSAASNADFASWVEYVVGESTADDARSRDRLRRMLRDFPRPNSLPVYSGLVVDSYGYIWLQQYTSPSGAGRRWIILSPDGTWLGSMEMPALLDVFQIGPDYVLGRWQDEVGREFVRLYPLRRDPEGLGRPPRECLGAQGLPQGGTHFPPRARVEPHI